MPGWRGEADEEDIERHAQHTVNNEGRREYKEAYELAMTMIGRGQSECKSDEPSSASHATQD